MTLQVHLRLYDVGSIFIFFTFIGLLSQATAQKQQNSMSPVQQVSSKILEFPSTGRFKIAHFTDLHFGLDDNYDEKTLNGIRTVLNIERPNLAILGGDQISQYGFNHSRGLSPREWLAKQWTKLVSPFQEYSVPWAMIPGNHDHLEGSVDDISMLAELDQSFEGSMTDLLNQLNYVLQIRPPRKLEYIWDPSEEIKEEDVKTNTKIIEEEFDPDLSLTYENAFLSIPSFFNLWFFNSHSYRCNGKKTQGCIESPQIDWYLSKSGEISSFPDVATSKIPSLAFVHIPLPEMVDVHNKGSFFGSVNDPDGICCSDENPGIFSAFLNRADVAAVTFGHDHGNDFMGTLHGIWLVYGRKSGFAGYTNELLQPGSRIYSISILPSDRPVNKYRIGNRIFAEDINVKPHTSIKYLIETWMRLSDGTKLTQKQSFGYPSFISGCCSSRPTENRAGHILITIMGILLYSLCAFTSRKIFDSNIDLLEFLAPKLRPLKLGLTFGKIVGSIFILWGALIGFGAIERQERNHFWETWHSFFGFFALIMAGMMAFWHFHVILKDIISYSLFSFSIKGMNNQEKRVQISMARNSKLTVLYHILSYLFLPVHIMFGLIFNISLYTGLTEVDAPMIWYCNLILFFLIYMLGLIISGNHLLCFSDQKDHRRSVLD